MGALFVTGMQRSGTTLLEKLLAAHPRLAVLSQPFPFVWLEAKRAFLQARGIDDPYPLGPVVGERRYARGDLETFLTAYRPARDTLRRCFAAMADYSGQYTKLTPAQIDAAIDGAPDGDLADVAAHLYRALSGRDDADWYGGKETICEELVPYLVGRGWRCAVIVRDPRDLLASLNTGKGREYGGDIKPTLFNLHHWRKSVAYALHLEGRRGFGWMRYEDLVAEPVARLDSLGLGAFDPAWFADGLRDQRGEAWAGNSSHGALGGVSAASVGGYADKLPAEVVRFAEAVCFAELRALGYELSIEAGEVEAALRGFREPYAIAREGLRGYTDDPARRADELRRWELLRAGAGDGPEALFVFPELRARLAASC